MVAILKLCIACVKRDFVIRDFCLPQRRKKSQKRSFHIFRDEFVVKKVFLMGAGVLLFL